MILLLDTSTPVCHLLFYKEGECVLDDSWQADRTLAEKIFTYIEAKLREQNADWHDISGIGVFRGPGSFTGLRIGMTVCNALANDRQIPIVGAIGDDWQREVLSRLENGENDGIVLPEYGRDARITRPRK